MKPSLSRASMYSLRFRTSGRFLWRLIHLLFHRRLCRILGSILDGLGMIDESDLFAVGRPVRLITVTGSEGADLPLPGAIGRMECELVLTAAIAPIRNVLSVRRPGGIPLRHSRGLRQIADDAVLSRDGEDLAAGLQKGTFPAR